MSQAVRKTNPANATKTYTGKVERYISGPTSDGFAILSLRLADGSKMSIKGRGVLVGFGIGDKLEVRGRLTTHPRFGSQVQAFDARVVSAPLDSTDALAKWIAEAGIEGIGKARAAAIADKLGENAVERIVRGDPLAKELLAKRYETVRSALTARYGEAKFGPKLTELGIGRQTRVKIYETFGTETGRVIEKDPYRLIMEVEGIAFRTADQIAAKAGMNKESDHRIMAAARDVLRQAEDEGHSWIPINEIVQQTSSLTDLPASLIARSFDQGACGGAVEVIVNGQKGWALQKLSWKENDVAQAILAKLACEKLATREDAEELVDRKQREVGIELNELQREAAIMAVMEPLCVITGGPGRGKTTVLDIIVRCWKELGRKIELGSPTGKAAQRMREKTGVRAQTMHRMLGISDGRFTHNDENPIEADAIAIDETSMLDIYLGAGFTRAWGEAQVLFIGDSRQIASVGPGRVFGDLVAAANVPTVELTENRRQTEGSAIAAGADAICAGRMPEWGHDLIFVEKRDNEDIAKEVERIFLKETSQGNKVQILTPGHASEAGTSSLNARLAIESTESDPVVRLTGGAPAHVGDEVIQLENCDGRDVFNGDVGRIVEIRGRGKEQVATVEIETPSGPRRLDYSSGQMSELALAWALTVHKAQGSEYDVVVMPMTTSHWKLLRRTLFNTGITRAKVRCYVVGQKRAIRQAVAFDDGNLRNTRLKELIEQG